MLILLTIAFIFHLITGKDTSFLLEKLKVLKLEQRALSYLIRIKNALLTGFRFVCRQLLHFFYFMTSRGKPILDKILILIGIVYIFVQSDFFPYKIIGFMGSLDDIFMVLCILLIIWKDIKPEVIENADQTIHRWTHRNDNTCAFIKK